MLTMTYIAVFLIFMLVSCVTAFLVGRCGRRVPFLDNHLPWTMHRGQAPSADDAWTACRSEPDQHRSEVQQ